VAVDRRDGRRPGDRDPAREALGRLAVRRLGRAGHRCQLGPLHSRRLTVRATWFSSQLYKLGNYRVVHRLVRGNTMTPTFTRGPGESLGVSTLEMGMDELAYPLGMDPPELRVRRHT